MRLNTTRFLYTQSLQACVSQRAALSGVLRKSKGLSDSNNISDLRENTQISVATLKVKTGPSKINTSFEKAELFLWRQLNSF